ncbi:MAG: hypothetical protein ABI861_11320 [Panacibacter sp.]
MKKNVRLITLQILTVASALLMLSSCSKDHSDKTTQTYTIYSPVYKARSEVLASINGVSTTTIEHAGKLYIKDNFIYLNEVNKGIHIIDNSNTSHPVQVAFLAIPGNLDIAIKGNILYADMYDELLALDISDMHHVKISNTLKNFFTGRGYVNGYVANSDDQIAVDWKEKDTTVLVENNYCRECNGGVLAFDANGPKAASGVAGSMAGMVLMNNYLYAISEMHSLGIVDVTNPSAPKLDSSFFAGYDLQTIFPFEDKLFLGSAIGMFMYDVSDPRHPVSIGQFEHGRACDPVIADASYAYVTLHAGDGCGGDQNELDVIDITNLENSSLVKTYTLTKPTGLAKDGHLLFVCDGTEVKVYDAANPLKLIILQQIKSNEPYDVIVANKKALVVTADGLYQYDYSNISNIRLLSFLAAKK